MRFKIDNMPRQYLRTRDNLRGVEKILAGIKQRRKGKLRAAIPQLQKLWQNTKRNDLLTPKSLEIYIYRFLDRPSFWLGLYEHANVPSQETGDRVCQRFYHYLGAIGYEPAERQQVFTELAKYNPAIRSPEDTRGEQR